MSLGQSAHAIKLQKGLDDIKIISANKLSYKNNKTLLSGDVIIKVKDIYISSPNVAIEEKKKADFTGSVNINSKDLNLVADRMEIDIKTGYITLFNAKSKIKDYKVDSDMQILHLEKGTFKASALDGSHVTTRHEDINVSSDSLVALFEGDGENINDLLQIKFQGNVIAEKEDSKIMASKLLLYPPIKQYRAINDAIFINKKEKLIVKANFMNLEENDAENKDYTLLATSNSESKRVKVLCRKRRLFANSRLTRLWLKNNKVEKIVFSGDSDIRLNDRKLEGEEIVLNNETKELISNLDRPKAILLK